MGLPWDLCHGCRLILGSMLWPYYGNVVAWVWSESFLRFYHGIRATCPFQFKGHFSVPKKWCINVNPPSFNCDLSDLSCVKLRVFCRFAIFVYLLDFHVLPLSFSLASVYLLGLCAIGNFRAFSWFLCHQCSLLGILEFQNLERFDLEILSFSGNVAVLKLSPSISCSSGS